MTENLRTKKYKDGTSIPYIIADSEWPSLITDAYCWYLNDPESYKTTYGALYNWYAVNTDKLCPTGWHVPTRADWITLSNYLGGKEIAGSKLNSTTGWINEGNGTDEYAFNALPGGFRAGQYYYHSGEFSSMGETGSWWTSTAYDLTSVWFWDIYYNDNDIFDSTTDKSVGYSVRCIKN